MRYFETLQNDIYNATLNLISFKFFYLKVVPYVKNVLIFLLKKVSLSKYFFKHRLIISFDRVSVVYESPVMQ